MTEPERVERRFMERIFTEKKAVLDIGGGLRIKKGQGNRYRAERAWLSTLAEKVDYRIMDPVDTYHPDIVGDIHHMPFPDDSQEAIICASVLEHVEDPFTAANELYRVLAPGGYLYVYVPFLYYYHAEKGYYGDYWRFSEEAIRVLFKRFTSIEISPVRGALETWVILNPHTRRFSTLARWVDAMIGKDKTKQVSAYQALLVK